MSTNNFSEAYHSYKYLRERGFPEKASIKLVGDRYRLTRVQRNCLFRGVIETATASRRLAKIIQPAGIASQPLALDWYNVLITVESYLKGLTVLLADDGVLRDSTAVHGSYRKGPVTEKAVSSILEGVGALEPASVDVFLDSPIAFSGEMAEQIRRRLAGLAFPSVVSLDRSADFALKSYDGIVASSDSVVMDRARAVIDLPRFVLERSFAFIPRPLPDLDP
jgi:hypothetical protein